MLSARRTFPKPCCNGHAAQNFFTHIRNIPVDPSTKYCMCCILIRGEMTVATALAGQQSAERLVDLCSIEITAKDGDKVEQLKGRIPEGTLVSITFLPGEDAPTRVATARTVREAGFIPVAHISARRLGSEQELDEFLAALVAEAQVDHVFVIAGDLPAPSGPYLDALAVIKSGLLARHGIKHVGISGYPEGHPDITKEKLETAMRDKLAAIREAGQSAWIATQFGFDADPILPWIAGLRAEGIDVPVRLGVAGPSSIKALLRFATRCGVGVSAKVMAKYGLSITNLLGRAGPGPLINELQSRLIATEHGEVRLHFYPFGGLEKTADWIRENA